MQMKSVFKMTRLVELNKFTNVHSLDGQGVWGRMDGYVYMCG